MKRVLVLGAGLVSRPLVRHFLDLDEYRVDVASVVREEAERVAGDHPRARALELDVSDASALSSAVARADLVVSLVPYALHSQVARAAVAHGVDMITTSYVSPEMRALDAAARAADVVLLNELGLDPGLDHMSALRLIRRAEQDGARVHGFRSCCGVIPADPDANPWRYQFSWSPRGVFLAARQGARFLERGRVVELPASQLFDEPWPCTIEGVGTFEIYANRDSLPYVEAYGLREPEEMLRATLRHPGWSETMRALGRLGLLDIEPRTWPAGSTYRDLLDALLPADPGTTLESRVEKCIGAPGREAVMERLVWAELLSDRLLGEGDAASSAGTSPAQASPLDLLVAQLQRKLSYGPGERDMVVLQHEVSARAGSRERRHVSRLVAYGEPRGETATARTVSLPAAVAGQLLLEGRIAQRGVLIPTSPELYEPVLERLEDAGIRLEEDDG